jgi:nicotinamide-nucleotide amidase
MFAAALLQEAERLLDALRARGMRLTTAESCTGGLIAGLLTEIAGSSDVLERAFVTYSNDAKVQMLGVPEALLRAEGAVSSAVAGAMAEGAILHSRADLAIAATGVAGPGGGTAAKPVGLVHLAAARRNEPAVLHRTCHFGSIGRTRIRIEAVTQALDLARAALDGKQ